MSGKLRLIIGMTLLGLAGGCGDSSVVIIIGKQPPAVTATTPQNGAVNVEPASVVSAVFNQAMNPATINAATFTLRTAAGPLNGQVGYDSTTRTARFTPDQPLPLLATCTATLGSAIRSAEGLNLRGDYVWSFTTRDGSPAVPLTTAAEVGASPPTTLVTAPDGSTLEVWLEAGEDGRRAVFAECYLATADRWSSPPGPLSTPQEDCLEAAAAGDAEGNALIAWVCSGEEWRVVFSRYQAAGDRWLAAKTVSREDNRISGLRIETGAGGRFSISWQVEDNPLPLMHTLHFE